MLWNLLLNLFHTKEIDVSFTKRFKWTGFEQMELELVRVKSTPHSVSGKLAIDGVFECFTLERPLVDPDYKCIPEGKYTVTIRTSKRFNRLMPHIEAVPGRDGIEIHWGNYPKDTEGCVLVGQQVGDDAVWTSQIAFDKLFNRLQTYKGQISIVVSNTFNQGDENEKVA